MSCFLWCVAVHLLASDVALPGTEKPRLQLQWSEVEKSIAVPWDAKTVSTTFTCTNPTAQPIRIAIDSSCGCMATAPEPNPLPPGATGTLSVTMPVGFRSGLVNKSISIKTDPPSAVPVVLQLKLDIPILATVRPSFVHWQVGEAATPRLVTAAIEPGFPVTFTGIKASDTVLSATWEPTTTRTGGHLRITPKSTAMPWNGTVVLLTDSGRDFIVFCRCIAPDVQPAGVKGLKP